MKIAVEDHFGFDEIYSLDSMKAKVVKSFDNSVAIKSVSFGKTSKIIYKEEVGKFRTSMIYLDGNSLKGVHFMVYPSRKKFHAKNTDVRG